MVSGAGAYDYGEKSNEASRSERKVVSSSSSWGGDKILLDKPVSTMRRFLTIPKSAPSREPVPRAMAYGR